MSAVNQYYGKYRGTVTSNLDPLALGRLQVAVPAVKGLAQGWALPCVPYAGKGVGFYVIPPVGANVWVEFEGGDPSYPIWAGCFWETGEVPGEPALPEKKVWKTQALTLVLNDVEAEGGFSLTVGPPAIDLVMSITVDKTGITLRCPESTVKMTPEMVEVTVPEAKVTVSAESISLNLPASTLSLSPETITLTVPPATATLSAELLKLAIAASSIAMTGEGMKVGSTEVSVSGAIGLSPKVSVTGELGVTGDSSFKGLVGIEGIKLIIAAITEILGAVAITGAVDVTGALLIDGQPPMLL